MLRKAYTPASMFMEAFALLIIGILFFADPEDTTAFAISAIYILPESVKLTPAICC